MTTAAHSTNKQKNTINNATERSIQFQVYNMFTRAGAAGTICFDGVLASPCPKVAGGTDTVTVSPFPSRADVCPSVETAKAMPHFMSVPTSMAVSK